jgi:hypothetical protein
VLALLSRVPTEGRAEALEYLAARPEEAINLLKAHT